MSDLAPEEIIAERLAICSNCEHFSTQKVCKLCYCHMNDKTKQAYARCPINKWQPVDILDI